MCVTNMTKLTTSTPQSSRAEIWKVAVPFSLLHISSLLLFLLQEDLSQ
jgi:hypothetical protein